MGVIKVTLDCIQIIRNYLNVKFILIKKPIQNL